MTNEEKYNSDSPEEETGTVHENERRSSGAFSRRTACAAVIGGAVALAIGGLKALPAEARVRPPGGQDEDRFLSRCIRCGRCVMVCPWHVLRPARLDEGVLNALTPIADFNQGWCDLCKGVGRQESPLCVSNCPTDALKLPAGYIDGRGKAEEGSENVVVLGKAVITPDWCLPWARGEKCKLCYRACPNPKKSRAISLDSQGRPTVDIEKCIGCGACQKACPTPEEGSLAPSPNLRAIMVVPQ